MTNINYSLSRKVGEVLQHKGLTLVTAESCTGGGLAEDVTAVAGSSGWFERGFVTYTNTAKIEMLGVDPQILQSVGAVSSEVAEQMAQGALANSHADIAISITGVAGPAGGSDKKPVGTVWFGLATREGFCESRSDFFAGGRKNVRRESIRFAFSWVLEKLSQ